MGNPKLLSVNIEQFEPYTTDIIGLTRKEALQTILDWLERNGLNSIIGETKVMIVPGYKFRFVDGLITNFHQPGSTLMLLVAAFIGEDWKKVYEAALSNDYRFLSYGDSSLLLPISSAKE
jgi:S-adenosylmethionine:tRNA ribosyltransferase-isomerase